MANQPQLVSNSLSLMFLGSFLLAAFFAEILVRIGIPFNYVCLLFFAFAFASYLFAGMLGATMQGVVFDRGDTLGESIDVGQALASAVISSGIYVLLAGHFQISGLDALAMYIGWTIGLALMVFLFSSVLARSKQSSLAGAICGDSASRFLRGIVAVSILICSAMILVASYEIIDSVVSRFVGLPGSVAVVLVSIPVLFCVIAGGMHSLSIIRRLAYPVIAITFLAPITWISIKQTGFPLPQFAYGSGALVPIDEIDRDMIDAGIATMSTTLSIARDGRSLDGFNFLSVLVSFSAGVAVMPHVIQHFRSVDSGSMARRSGIWSFALVLIVLTAVPAIAAFSKLGIYTSMLGINPSDISEEIPWIFELSGAGDIPLFSLCGQLVRDSADVVAACGNDPQYFLSPRDIGIDYRFVVLGSALINDLPLIVTAILVGGSVLAIMTAIDGLVLVMAKTIGQDFYVHFCNRGATGGRTLFVTRAAIVLCIVFGAYSAAAFEFDELKVLTAGFSVAAGVLFPLFLARTWLRGVNSIQCAIAGAIGLLATLTTLFLTGIGPDLVGSSGDELVLRVPLVTERLLPESAGLIGLVCSVCAILGFTAIGRGLLKTRFS